MNLNPLALICSRVPLLQINIRLTAYPILANVGLIAYHGESSNEYILAYYT